MPIDMGGFGTTNYNVGPDMMGFPASNQMRGPDMAGLGYALTPVDLGATMWIDYTDPTTLFTDAAGTLPVQNDGDQIAFARSKIPGPLTAITSIAAQHQLYKTNLSNGRSAGRSDGLTSIGRATVFVNQNPPIALGDFTDLAAFAVNAKTLIVAAVLRTVLGGTQASPQTARLIVGDKGSNRFGLAAYNIDATHAGLSCYNFDTAIRAATFPGILQDQWFVVTARHDGATLTIRVNGVPGVPTASNPTTTMTGSVTVGSQSAGNFGQNDIAQLATWNKVLTDDEVFRMEAYFAAPLGIVLGQ